MEELNKQATPEEAISPEEKVFKDEFSQRLDEIGEKFKGELTPEQKKEKALLEQKVATDAMKKVSELWNALPRHRKRELTPAKNKYAAKLKKRLK
jgi:hypothetical protein